MIGLSHEWVIRNAWIKNKYGKKIIDFKDNNLHVVNYSSPFKGRLKQDLKKNLHTIPKNLMQSHMSLHTIIKIGDYV